MANTVYSIVTINENGGEMVESFSNKETALIEVNKMKRHFRLLNIQNVKVYLSELNYDSKQNRILDDKLVNPQSTLKIEC
ncbi:hypothetical protein [Staphylococcus equorum]|uniref:Uncharacterized protein n=1 Tax=Staphylococcus equorum TaxID=246432 RepID=A0AAP7LUY7_9STAP|nr:hypothetical protein [Staphylococcus equorum]OEK58922.1 hypothetical protein ASS94_00945 [Staphylococcus equorum]